MAKYLKTPIQKLETKLNSLNSVEQIKRIGKKFKFKNKVILTYNTQNINYSKFRYYPSKKEPLIEDTYTVSIPLNHENLSLLGFNPINPPNNIKIINDLFKFFTDKNFEKIILGSKENLIENNTLHISKGLFDLIVKINKEESVDKKIKIRERVYPFLFKEFSIENKKSIKIKDFSLLFEEIIASGQLNQSDILKLYENLEIGENNQILIEKQITKQVEWLIETLEEIIDIENVTIPKAKEIGNKYFGFLKSDIEGPENLMEKILSKYGQYTFFGVPALLNTKKYVKKEGLSNSQFDILLINHLGEIEVVELKKFDERILEYDSERGKFYPSKSLAIALAQAERYISTVNKDNDDEFLIDGKKIREYIFEQIGDTLYKESIRPSAIIIIGSWKSLHKDYEKLTQKTREKVSKKDYINNGLRTYREIKSSFRNISILNYSELLSNARTRLQLLNDKN